MNEATELELREVVSLLKDVILAAGENTSQALAADRAGYLLERLARAEADGLETLLVDELKHALQV